MPAPPPLPAPRWGEAPPPVTPQQRQRAVLMFVLTLISVFLVFGYQWQGGDPLGDPAVAWASLQFSGTLMAILLAHEMGHYIVARRHGFALSLPYFLPFPFAFGTLGAVIQLKSLPRSRTALLEMGAAGPLAGFVLSALALLVGLPGTTDPGAAEMVVPSAEALAALSAPPAAPGLLDQLLGVLLLPFVALGWVLEQLGTVPAPVPDALSLSILANPPMMDWLGVALLGAPPGRYAHLEPVAFAGWVGCLLTAINLIPIGQLDGGHILNALWPRGAPVVSRAGVAVLLAGGLLVWPGWAVWGVLLLAMRAWVSLPVPEQPGLTLRARVVAVLTLLAWGCTFMPRPIELEQVPYDEIRWLDEDGVPTELPEILRGKGAAGEEAAPEEG